eukprot:919162_1
MPPQTSSQNDDIPSADSQSKDDAIRTSLRICCYGSSSKSTQNRYLTAAYSLGYELGIRGHSCVNGGGASGCMGSMNQGCLDSNGSVIGVIHKMFVYEDRGSKWLEGCHKVFRQNEGRSDKRGSKAKLIITDGVGLQERKRMLVEGADAIVVLPGGTGTFDELWEMACAKQIGIVSMPIVCVNIDGYYDAFVQILQRAKEDNFLYKDPGEILHFEKSSEEAIDYIEKELAKQKTGLEAEGDGEKEPTAEMKKRGPSFMSQLYTRMSSSLSSFSDEESYSQPSTFSYLVTFASGAFVYSLISRRGS